MDTLGLYVHIPFCAGKCIYCDFYSIPRASDGTIDSYIAALKAQAERLGRTNALVDTVYFGGGTPSCIGAERLSGLMQQLKSSFNIAQGAEITLEANPESSDPALLNRVRKAGFNRISFGVQSFCDAELKAIGRLHDAECAKKAVLNARDAGFDNISIDLIYGLPNQTPASLRRSLETAVKLPVCHISCYGLRAEEGTPLMASPLLKALPDDDTQADMYIQTEEFLKKHGFYRYEISNFAKDGRESRHNIKYWRLEPYLGLGAAAHSDYMGERFGAVRSIEGYIAGEAAGQTALSERSRPSQFERAQEYVMLGLRTREGIALSELTERWSINASALFQAARRLTDSGLALSEGGRLRLTTAGMLLSNRVICELWDCMGEAEL